MRLSNFLSLGLGPIEGVWNPKPSYFQFPQMKPGSMWRPESNEHRFFSGSTLTVSSVLQAGVNSIPCSNSILLTKFLRSFRRPPCSQFQQPLTVGIFIKKRKRPHTLVRPCGNGIKKGGRACALPNWVNSVLLHLELVPTGNGPNDPEMQDRGCTLCHRCLWISHRAL